jgi:hypothetical protein
MGILPTHWYYNTESGVVQQGNNFDALGNNLFGGLGWHELNIPGGDTEAQAAAAAIKEFPKGKPPTSSVVKGIQNQAPAPVLTGLAAIGDFFQRLTQGNTWLRIGEGLLGIILIAVGLAHMTRAVPIATAIARKVP